MANTANPPTAAPFNGTVPLLFSVLGAAAALMAAFSIAYWIDPSGTTASCGKGDTPAVAECLTVKRGAFEIESLGGGLGGGLFLTIGILGILKKPASH